MELLQVGLVAPRLTFLGGVGEETPEFGGKGEGGSVARGDVRVLAGGGREGSAAREGVGRAGAAEDGVGGEGGGGVRVVENEGFGDGIASCGNEGAVETRRVARERWGGGGIGEDGAN